MTRYFLMLPALLYMCLIAHSNVSPCLTEAGQLLAAQEARQLLVVASRCNVGSAKAYTPDEIRHCLALKVSLAARSLQKNLQAVDMYAAASPRRREIHQTERPFLCGQREPPYLITAK